MRVLKGALHFVAAITFVLSLLTSKLQAWTFSAVPPTPNPKNKINQRLLNQVLPNELKVDGVRILPGGGRLVFDDTSESAPIEQWSSVLSPTSIKSLRVVVGQIQGQSPETTQDEIMSKLLEALPENLPWDLYTQFGNKPVSRAKRAPSNDVESAKLDVSCRRWASFCIPKAHVSTTSLKQQLKRAIIEKWGGDPLVARTHCEFSLLLLEDKCWLEWTLLVPPSAAAILDLPRPGCKRVEAWMLVESCRDKILNSAHRSDATTPVVVMDPLCGKGTYLVEAATTLPLSTLPRSVSFVGVDMSPAQLVDAAVNVERTNCGKTVVLREGDSRDMTWQPDGSVHIILTCPPFGRQFGRESDLPSLYREWMKEWTRVLDPHGGQMALLVDVDHEDVALAAIRETNRLQVKIHRDPFRLGRLKATVIVSEMSSAQTVGQEQVQLQPSPMRRFIWESNAKESRAEWARLRAETLQALVPYTQRT